MVFVAKKGQWYIKIFTKIHVVLKEIAPWYIRREEAGIFQHILAYTHIIHCFLSYRRHDTPK
jgi:hypothetical protein